MEGGSAAATTFVGILAMVGGLIVVVVVVAKVDAEVEAAAAVLAVTCEEIVADVLLGSSPSLSEEESPPISIASMDAMMFAMMLIEWGWVVVARNSLALAVSVLVWCIKIMAGVGYSENSDAILIRRKGIRSTQIHYPAREHTETFYS